MFYIRTVPLRGNTAIHLLKYVRTLIFVVCTSVGASEECSEFSDEFVLFSYHHVFELV